jgi:integrase
MNFMYRGEVYRFSLGKPPAKILKYVTSTVRTKFDADTVADRIKLAIKDGTFDADDTATVPDPQTIPTLAQLGKTYFETYRIKKGGAALSDDERSRWDLTMRTEIRRANDVTVQIGDLAADALTLPDLEALRSALLAERTEVRKNKRGRLCTRHYGGLIGTHRSLSRLRNFYRWAVKRKHATQNPFTIAKDSDVTLFVDEGDRERRLEPAARDDRPSEEARIFAAANPQLQALMFAALETGCRRGELLSLQWSQVRFDLDEIHLPAGKTKARKPRELPMSQTLRSLLEMRRTDPTGRDCKPEHYVFGDVTGAQIKDVKTAWTNAVLKAHGIKVKRDKKGGLAPECQQHLKAINLHFHDLRREAGSRFLESGMPANFVQEFLGHADLKTTSRYLKITKAGLHAAMKRRDTVAPPICNPFAMLAKKPADAASATETSDASNVVH